MKNGKNKEIEENSSRDIYVCLYDENHIGLFKRIPWSIIRNVYNYDSGNIYVGIDNDHIGMDKIHEHLFIKNTWEPVGTFVKHNKKIYVSDCKIEEALNLDEIRLDMYLNGKIIEYTPGKVTSKELIDVLSYAYKYYDLDSEELDSEEVKKKKKY